MPATLVIRRACFLRLLMGAPSLLGGHYLSCNLKGKCEGVDAQTRLCDMVLLAVHREATTGCVCGGTRRHGSNDGRVRNCVCACHHLKTW
jgi:hypothetical protein